MWLAGNRSSNCSETKKVNSINSWESWKVSNWKWFLTSQIINQYVYNACNKKLENILLVVSTGHYILLKFIMLWNVNIQKSKKCLLEFKCRCCHHHCKLSFILTSCRGVIRNVMIAQVKSINKTKTILFIV